MEIEGATPEGSCFHLIFSEPSHAAAYLPFTWCLKPFGLRQLRKQGIKHPHLLLVIAERSEAIIDGRTHVWLNEVDRLLYPLDQGYGAITFTHPGAFVVHATIVFSADPYKSSNRKRAVRDLELRYLDECYGKTLVASHRYFETITDSIGHEDTVVQVAPEFFAKEPPAWLYAWGMWSGFSRKSEPRNECEWRKRLLYAFTIQPFVALVFYFLAFAFFVPIRGMIGFLIGAFVFCALGYRRVSFRPILHPFSSDLSDIINDGDGIFWDRPEHFWAKTKSNGCERHIALTTLVTPWRWAFMFCVSSAVVWWSVFGHFCALDVVGRVLRYALWATPLGMAFSAMLDTALAAWKRRHPAKKGEGGLGNRDAEKRLAEKKARYEAYYRERLIPLASFSTGPKEPTVSALPESHRTIRLRFEELKTKVCKPFAKR